MDAPTLLALVRFGPDGLAPCVVQDAASGEVLLLAYANATALGLTIETGQAHFWSRSRAELWRKGATTGNVLEVRQVMLDCDHDAVLLLVAPAGPVCHTGAVACFRDEASGAASLVPPSSVHPVAGDEPGRAATPASFLVDV